MPWKLRKAPKKDLYWVINKETGKKYSKEPLPKARAEAQMRALHANVPAEGGMNPPPAPPPLALPAPNPVGLINPNQQELQQQQMKKKRLKARGKNQQKRGGSAPAPESESESSSDEEDEEETQWMGEVRRAHSRFPHLDLNQFARGYMMGQRNRDEPEIVDINNPSFFEGYNVALFRYHTPREGGKKMKEMGKRGRGACMSSPAVPPHDANEPGNYVDVLTRLYIEAKRQHPPFGRNPQDINHFARGFQHQNNPLPHITEAEQQLPAFQLGADAYYKFHHLAGYGKKRRALKAMKGGRHLPREEDEEDEKEGPLPEQVRAIAETPQERQMRRMCEVLTQFYRPRMIENDATEADIARFYESLIEVYTQFQDTTGYALSEEALAEEANRLFYEFCEERITNEVDRQIRYYAELIVRDQGGDRSDVAHFEQQLTDYTEDEYDRYREEGTNPLTNELIEEAAENFYNEWIAELDRLDEEEEGVLGMRRRAEYDDDDGEDEPPAQRHRPARAAGKMRVKKGKGKGKKRLTGGALDEMEWNALSNDAIELGVATEENINPFMLHLESVIEAHDAVALSFGRGYILGLAGIMPQNEDEMAGFQAARGRQIGVSNRLSARGMRGKGFLGDMWDAGKQFAGRVFERVKQTGESVANVVRGKAPRLDLAPKVRQLLHNYGNRPIVRMFVRRDPIESAIDKALQVISLGSWSSLKQKYGYDSFFHLQLEVIVRVSDSDDTNARFVLQKNEVIDVSPAKPSTNKTEMVEVPMTEGHTMNSLLSNAKQTMGEKFYYYDAFHNNCQDFVGALLMGSGLLRPDFETFIKQPVDQLVQEISMTDRIARGITDLGGIVDVGIQGKGGLHPKAAFAAQLKAAGVAPSAYLEKAQKKAEALGLAGNMLGFSNDDKHKLQIPNADGKMIRFGAVKLGDYILYTLQKNPEAEKHRKAYLARATKIKGDWAKDPYSANSLAIGVLW